MRRWLLLVTALASSAMAEPLPTVTVAARGQTVPVGTAADDAADDPAIWRNRRAPSASLIVATDKKAGLYVYGLDGQVRHFVPAGRVNNVALIERSSNNVIVVASDRNDLQQARLRIYRLDTRAGQLQELGVVDAGQGEAYGVCLWNDNGRLHAFSVLKHGVTVQLQLRLARNGVSAKQVRQFTLATQTEGCVVDERTATLYVGEEDRGIWAMALRPSGSARQALVAQTDGSTLVADVEGLALAPQGRRQGWLVASSQGDNAFVVYRLPELTPVGRFRVGGGALGAVEETDGIDLVLGNFGPGFEQGLLVTQDGDNAPAAQNFKLVSWGDVLRALNLN
jgi:3-phytase